MRRAIALCVAFAACGGTARAADICLTLPQARAAYPAKYLMYHLNGGRRCWDAQSATRRTVRHRVSPLQTVPVPVPRQTVLWPSLASLATPVDAALLTAAPSTAWPRLLDIDELTADNPLLTSYWPPLEPPFNERWVAPTLPRVPITG